MNGCHLCLSACLSAYLLYLPHFPTPSLSFFLSLFLPLIPPSFTFFLSPFTCIWSLPNFSNAVISQWLLCVEMPFLGTSAWGRTQDFLWLVISTMKRRQATQHRQPKTQSFLFNLHTLILTSTCTRTHNKLLEVIADILIPLFSSSLRNWI